MPATDLRVWIATAAATLPSLLAYNVSPSPTFLNQALALALWGAFVVASAPAAPGRGPGPLLAALALVGAAVGWSWGPGALPSTLALSAIGMLLATAVVAAGGAGAAARGDATDLFAAFCWAWLVAGLFNVGIAVIQVFLPELPEGDWIARSGIAGRAVGNLRQPNHLSSLLLWAAIAAVALVELGRLGRRAGALALAALVFAVVLTASRTGLVSVLLLALWGAADRRLARPTRWLLLAMPLVYAVCWLGMAQWAAALQHTFGGAARLAESDISGSRFAIWANTLELISRHPWAGVGFGEFNLAWTLTPFPGRPVAFFDHTHNLPLQLAVELGLPLAAAVMALLLWALARGVRQAWAAEGGMGTAQRAAMLMVLMIGLHSQLEYPLWYSYFLLPAAWAGGFALRSAPRGRSAMAVPAAARAAPGLTLAGAALVVGALGSVVDYARVATIFSARPGAPPLEQRIADGRRSILFGHHADYAAVTSGVALHDAEAAFDRASHYLLDTRLMMAWAQALAAQGRVDEARHLAERLREFRKPDAAAFFEACPRAAGPAAAGAAASAPFQCELPARPPGWQEFLPGGGR
ncbi:MAG: Wzy polymerase domain-containing protein [Rubrivivax sp.]|nr:Wzy polymerase domain-containing protein [Rubrivivax sp.]